jgi:hypothetical protein
LFFRIHSLFAPVVIGHAVSYGGSFSRRKGEHG